MDLRINQLFRDTESNSLYRVIHSNLEEDEVFLIDIEKKHLSPKQASYADCLRRIITKKLEKVNEDPYSFLSALREEEISEKAKTIRDDRYKLIFDLINDLPSSLSKKTRTAHIEDLLKREPGISKQSINLYFFQYLKRGQIKGALLPDYFKSGGKGKIRNTKKVTGAKQKKVLSRDQTPITEKLRSLCKKFYQRYCLKKGFSHKKAYSLLIDKEFSYLNSQKRKVLKKRRISLDQFIYHGKKSFTSTEKMLQKEGEKKFNLNYRPLTKQSETDVSHIGRFYQIDATQLDMYVVSEIDPTKVIGRPTFIAVIDVFSRCFVGYYLGIQSASYETTIMALYDAISNGPESSNLVTGKGLPEEVIVDRGEVLNNKSQTLITSLNLTIFHTPSYRPDLKGIVERKFRYINEEILTSFKGFGAILPDFRQRGAKDYRLEAKLTISEVRQFLDDLMLKLNKNQKLPEDYSFSPDFFIHKVAPYPLSIWSYAQEYGKSRLREISDANLIPGLLPIERASITGMGVKFKGFYFSCPDTELKEIQTNVRRNHKSVKVKVHYDRRSNEAIYLRMPGSQRILLCPRTSQTKVAHVSFDEFELIKANHFTETETKEEEILEFEIERNKKTEVIKKIAAERDKVLKRINPESNTSKLKNIRDRKSEEIKRVQPKESFILPKQMTPEEKVEDEALNLVNELLKKNNQ